MAQVIIHIGLPKTGSTTLQSLLKTNREYLSKDCDVCVLLRADFKKLILFNEQIQKEGFGLRNRYLYAKRIRKMRRRIAKIEQGTIILSDEMMLGFNSGTLFNTDFDSGPRQAIQSLRDVFRGHQVRWIMYERDYESQKLSAYNQNVKVRTVSTSYEQWERDNCPPGKVDRLVAAMKADFADRLTTVSFEDERSRQGVWGAPLLRLAGLSAPQIAQLEVPEVANESIPKGLIDLKRRLNTIAMSKEDRGQVAEILTEAYYSAPPSQT